jgi:hypothetical protein
MEQRHGFGVGIVLSGLVLAAVQTLHGVQQSDRPLVFAFEAGPFVLIALALAYAGVWLARNEQFDPDLERILAWGMGSTLLFASVAALMLFSQRITLGTPSSIPSTTRSSTSRATTWHHLSGTRVDTTAPRSLPTTTRRAHSPTGVIQRSRYCSRHTHKRPWTTSGLPNRSNQGRRVIPVDVTFDRSQPAIPGKLPGCACGNRRGPSGKFKSARIEPARMAEVVPPTERECERCGRTDVWDETSETWVAVEDDGERLTGEPHCVHEWDITGNYNPFEGE